MALLYDAELTPSKPEMLGGWVPRQDWFVGDAGARPRAVGSYRFDDPDGEVGIETFLVRFGDGPTLQVPVTYRSAPLETASGDDPTPITTMEHSVLGRRWVYDGLDDPVYLATMASTVLTGGTEARLLLSDGTELPSRGRVHGSGSAGSPPADRSTPAADVPATAVETPRSVLRLRRVIEPLDPAEVAEPHLSGTWSESEAPTVLAILQPAAR